MQPVRRLFNLSTGYEANLLLKIEQLEVQLHNKNLALTSETKYPSLKEEIYRPLLPRTPQELWVLGGKPAVPSLESHSPNTVQRTGSQSP
jgi:hypothetical protein